MKIKSVTIETDKGAEVTMSFDEVDDFFNAMRRLKKSAAGPKEAEATNEPTAQQLLEIEVLKAQLLREQMHKEMLARKAMQPMITSGSGASGQALAAKYTAGFQF